MVGGEQQQIGASKVPAEGPPTLVARRKPAPPPTRAHQFAGQLAQVSAAQYSLEAQVMVHAEGGCTASMAAAFRRPPVEVMPFWREVVGATESRMASRTSAAVALGQRALYRAAAPETWGQAMEVPL